ncbi:hypothetical protein HanIR_Chr13g0634821 [Helianthus annuus]|nr:hypothetical protein HanIR_Chr13g0634821 [Helianthus annuus]
MKKNYARLKIVVEKEKKVSAKTYGTIKDANSTSDANFAEISGIACDVHFGKVDWSMSILVIFNLYIYLFELRFWRGLFVKIW